jgi:hypothetical protein
VQTVNFGFLSVHDTQLPQLGALAERYFHNDPATAIFKLRQFAELLCKTIAANHALYLGEREAFEETLRRLGSSYATCPVECRWRDKWPRLEIGLLAVGAIRHRHTPMITTMHSDQNASPPRVEVITSVQRRRRCDGTKCQVGGQTSALITHPNAADRREDPVGRGDDAALDVGVGN